MSRDSGYTLIELLVAVAVLGILLGVSAPAFQSVIKDSRQVTAYNQIASVLRFARSEAIKQSSGITVCPRSTDTACGTDWSKGMLVFHDALSNGNPLVLDSSDTILRVISTSLNGLTVSANAIVRPSTTTANQTSIRFEGRGQANWANGTWLLCDDRGEAFARALIVNGAGVARSAYPTDSSSGVVVDARGTAVDC